jgi:hypothetical protein
MKVELLYFDGCPGYERARWALEDALVQEDIRADMETISVDTDEAARKHRFPGSPTIRIDGLDLFPVERLGSKPEWHLGGCIAYQERPRWHLCCRLYQTPDGQKDHPTTEMIRKRLIDR